MTLHELICKTQEVPPDFEPTLEMKFDLQFFIKVLPGHPEDFFNLNVGPDICVILLLIMSVYSTV